MAVGTRRADCWQAGRRSDLGGSYLCEVTVYKMQILAVSFLILGNLSKLPCKKAPGDFLLSVFWMGVLKPRSPETNMHISLHHIPLLTFCFCQPFTNQSAAFMSCPSSKNQWLAHMVFPVLLPVTLRDILCQQ